MIPVMPNDLSRDLSCTQYFYMIDNSTYFKRKTNLMSLATPAYSVTRRSKLSSVHPCCACAFQFLLHIVKLIL